MLQEIKDRASAAQDRYFSPTPPRMRKIGDAIMIMGTGIQGGMMGLPVDDNTKAWAMFGVSIVSISGKILTNFFKDDSEP